MMQTSRFFPSLRSSLQFLTNAQTKNQTSSSKQAPQQIFTKEWEDPSPSIQQLSMKIPAALLQAGADPSAVDAFGRTAYFYAIDFANKNAIQKLWEAGANPMLKARDGLDTFHYAIMSEKKELIEDLPPVHSKEK